MTSANVTHYELYDQNMSLLATESQNALCQDKISKVLDRWEVEFPHAYLCLRWPDENGCDQYLTFDELDGYDDFGFDPDMYMCDPRDTITLQAFLRRKRQEEIASNEHMLEYLREKLREHTGNQSQEGFNYNKRREYRVFKNDAMSEAEDIGAVARCYIGADGEFVKEFIINCGSLRNAKMVAEFLEEFGE
jgi:hypothetical protein